jgi:hypothetical protein
MKWYESLGVMLLLILFLVGFWYKAEYRNCGFNPLKQLVQQECYCENQSVYIGYWCGSCDVACGMYQSQNMTVEMD